LTDGVGDYPAMRNIRTKKTAAAGKVKKRPRACINVINNNGDGGGGGEKNLRRTALLR